MKIKVTNVNYQRNGISGEGFFMLNFTASPDDEKQDFLCVIFPNYDENGNVESEGNPKIAIMNYDENREIDFKGCWRGDHFQDVILEALRGYEDDEFVDYSGNPFDGAIGIWSA
jgi:hypothetical protein